MNRANLMLLQTVHVHHRMPHALKGFLKSLGLNVPFHRFKSYLINRNKYTDALAFQVTWAQEFARNRERVQEYWERFRDLPQLKEVCDNNAASCVLDVGCGISSVLHYLEGRRYGIDPLANEYKKLYRYPRDIDIQQGHGEEIPFRDEFFDTVFCCNVLDHVSRPEQVMDEIRRVLRPGGKFVLAVEVFSERRPRDLKHPFSFTREDVAALCGVGFEIIYERRAPWISLRSYVNGSTHSENEELISVFQKRES
jgi:SAM-dependent methyltransferase